LATHTKVVFVMRKRAVAFRTGRDENESGVLTKRGVDHATGKNVLSVAELRPPAIGTS
jgi:hypothetical protein